MLFLPPQILFCVQSAERNYKSHNKTYVLIRQKTTASYDSIIALIEGQQQTDCKRLYIKQRTTDTVSQQCIFQNRTGDATKASIAGAKRATTDERVRRREKRATQNPSVDKTQWRHSRHYRRKI